ncbi:type IV secretion system protein VirB10 [Azotobacter beijerinckii]|uniref:Type IV secretion system protein VirB10 n=1 Tax=Azotobacter beijerinckii TaxID=170623 RepID=A0A1H9K248_9GAMM|nr:TrbI/VirB10 family protein [Azotobacter beijerinckii]SEQ93286.1 type IV secretion system protein VirB10 [Azotobacter beijerinckii]
MSTATDDQMSPDASPGELSKKTGVRRVNNWPMYILGGAGLTFLIVMMLVAADRAAQQKQPAPAPAEKGGNTSMFAQEIAGNHTSGIIPPEATKPPEVPELTVPDASPAAPTPGALAVVRPDDLDKPPVPPSRERTREDDELERIRMAKMQQFQEAVKAKTTVQVVAPRSSGSSNSDATLPTTQEEALARIAAARQRLQTEAQSDPTAAYQARLEQLRGAGIGGTSDSMGGTSDSSDDSPFLTQVNNSSRNSYDQFSNRQGGDRWELQSRTEAPRSPFELRAGFVVPATLISGINSDLPGQIMAQIAQDVYDTPTGRHLLIPQGSRLVGEYSSDVAYGQSRVLVAWQRIVFPDGKAMDIGSMSGADSAGYSGFKDRVKNHYLRLFGSALFMSAVTAGISLSQDNNSSGFENETTASSAMSEALGQQLGQATAQLISKNANIAPTLDIRPGFRFNVMVTKDMTFSKPYKSFDY